MAGHTSNINLAKPTYSEDADIAVINSNMDIIDGKMGAVGSTSLQSQVDAANAKIAATTITASDLSDLQGKLDSAYPGSGFATFCLSNTTSGNVGLETATHMCTLVAMDSNSKVVVAYRLSGAEIRINRKGSGTWADTWTKYVSDLDSKITDELGYSAAIDDLNNQTTRMAKINADTLNTPYKAGLTTSSQGISLQSGSGNYNQQIVMANGDARTYIRCKSGGTWGSWDEFALNSNLSNYNNGGTNKMISNTDLHTLNVTGRYYIANGCTNLPTGCSHGYVDVYVYLANAGNEYKKLVLYDYNTAKSWTKYCSGGTWGSWVENINKSDSAIKSFDKASSASHDISIPSSSRFFIMASTSGNTRYWIGYIIAGSNGSITVTELAKGSNTTVTATTNNLNIAFDTAATLNMTYISLYGNKELS